MRTNQRRDAEFDAACYVGVFESSLWLWVESAQELGFGIDHVFRGTRWFDVWRGVMLCCEFATCFFFN
jgi:hypothetical protein